MPAGQSKTASAHQAVSPEISNDEEAEPVSISHLQCLQQLLMYILNLQIAQTALIQASARCITNLLEQCGMLQLHHLQAKIPSEPEASKPERKRPKHSSADLIEKAQKAAANGRTIFYGEGEGIPVKEGGTLFYDAASSKLLGMNPKAIYISVS